MAPDAPAHLYLLGVSIPVIGTILVALIARDRGRKAGASDAPFKAQESGEHAHTRDIIRDGFDAQRASFAEVHRRFDLIEAARGAQRQSEQMGVSAARLEERNSE